MSGRQFKLGVLLNTVKNGYTWRVYYFWLMCIRYLSANYAWRSVLSLTVNSNNTVGKALCYSHQWLTLGIDCMDCEPDSIFQTRRSTVSVMFSLLQLGFYSGSTVGLFILHSLILQRFLIWSGGMRPWRWGIPQLTAGNCSHSLEISYEDSTS